MTKARVLRKETDVKTLLPAFVRFTACACFSAVALGIAVHAPAQTQTQMNQDACAVFERADTELNAVYRHILAAYEQAPQFTEKLTKAQRAWVAFRDAHLEAVYPDPDKQAAYGSAYAMCRCFVLAELTKRRVDELKQWLNGVPEGEVCGGSIRRAAPRQD
jgi:uncharacterized protein YecT (DUF1311 family)